MTMSRTQQATRECAMSTRVTMQVRYFRQSVFLDYMLVVLDPASGDRRMKLAIQAEVGAKRAKRLSEPSLSISSASSARSPRPISIHSDPISIAAFFTPSFYLETRVILSLVLWSGLDGCSDEFRFGVSDLTWSLLEEGPNTTALRYRRREPTGTPVHVHPPDARRLRPAVLRPPLGRCASPVGFSATRYRRRFHCAESLFLLEGLLPRSRCVFRLHPCN